MPKVSFTLPAEQYERIAARATIAEQSVNDFVRDRLIASLTPKSPAVHGTTTHTSGAASTNSLARTTVEPRWKTKDLPKAKAKP